MTCDASPAELLATFIKFTAIVGGSALIVFVIAFLRFMLVGRGHRGN